MVRVVIAAFTCAAKGRCTCLSTRSTTAPRWVTSVVCTFPMVTTVADTLFSRLIDAFPAGRAYSPDDFSRDPMPAPLQSYLEERLRHRLSAVVLADEEWFDRNHPDVQKAANTYREVVHRHAQIPASAWHEELRNACRRVVTYLVEPATTLTNVVFDGGTREASLEEISSRLRLFPSYTYFGEVIGAYFEQKNLGRIDKDRFAALVRRIDHQMTRDFDAEEWMKLLEPLLSVIRQIPEFSGGIPVDVLKTFLEEKKADGLKARLESRFEKNGARLIGGSELRQLFEQPDTQEEQPSTPPATEHRDPSTLREPAHHGGSVPLWKQYESGTSKPPGRAQAASSTSRGDAAPAAATEAQPLWKQFRKSESPSAHRPAAASQTEAVTERVGPATDDSLTGLERAVLGEKGSRNRSLFLKHLFSGSTEDYEDTLRELDTAENWSQASQIIAREVFLKHQVNIYSDPAVAFTDAAEARFRS